VVVDDGSTDDTRAVMARSAGDRRVRYVHQPRGERAAARNRGIRASDSPLVAFLDADDLWRPEKLARQVEALGAAPDAGLCYTVARFIDADGHPIGLRKPSRLIGGDVFGRLMRANVLILASVVVRRRCLDALGGFDERLPVYGAEDWDLWLRVARHHRVVAIDEELTRYRRHAANTGWEQVLASAFAVIDKWYADPATARAAGITRAEARALHYWVNAGALAMDRRAAALPLIARALRESTATVFSRTALAAVARLLLPSVALRGLAAPTERS